MPNSFSPAHRAFNISQAVVLLAWGAYGVYRDSLWVPGRRTSGGLLHGPSAWFVCAAMVVTAANLLTVVVDHYDTRNNEHQYRRFRNASQIVAWSLFLVGLVLSIVHNADQTLRATP